MKQPVLKSVFLVNYIFLILQMCWLIKEGTQLGILSSAPLLISSLMLIDITYIDACNLRGNRVVSMFCGLLALDSWYILLSFRDGFINNLVFTALSPVIWYCSIKFVLLFLFQGSGFKLRRPINIILLITSIGSLAGLCISDKVFAGMYGIQFLAGIVCFFLAVLYNWKRVVFVFKSEWKSFLFSFCSISIFFFIYYFATRGIADHISNFGIYLPAVLFFVSVHGIVQKEQKGVPLSTVFTLKQMVLILSFSFLSLGLFALFLGGGFAEILVFLNALSAFIYLCNIILGQSLKQGESKIIKQSEFDTALQLLKKEEQLKAEFSDFLHDDVLQDLLSVKNMMSKVHRIDIQDIITDTLDSMNRHIREQMQDYHPVILKKLTPKENYQNLIEGIGQSFLERKISVSFDCANTLFLAEPYDVLLYRLLKELITNVYKHSNGSRAWVTLTQEKGIIDLGVSDDGYAESTCLTAVDLGKHKGIASILERVKNMEGVVTISNNTPHGICIQITLPMKGDVSYKHFVS